FGCPTTLSKPRSIKKQYNITISEPVPQHTLKIFSRRHIPCVEKNIETELIEFFIKLNCNSLRFFSAITYEESTFRTEKSKIFKNNCCELIENGWERSPQFEPVDMVKRPG